MNIQAVLYLCVLLSHAWAENYTLGDCPSSVTRDKYLRVFGASCYSFVVSHQREFSAAERECEAHGGHLVIVRDEATQLFVYETLSQDLLYNGVLWLGLSDKAAEGHFVWVDGNPVTYSNWAPGEANGSATDCAAMDVGRGGFWHDYRCQGVFFFIPESHAFVCEYPIPATTTTLTPSSSMMSSPAISTLWDDRSDMTTSAHRFTTQDCPDAVPRDNTLRVFGSSCFSFQISHRREYLAAERDCQSRSGHLAVIPDASTQHFVYATLHSEFNYRSLAWIGFDDRATADHFVWTDGSETGYSHWAPQEPDTEGGVDQCVGMDVSRGGNWYVARCSGSFLSSASHAFVCQYPIAKPTVITTTTTEPTTTTASATPTTVTTTPTTPATLMTTSTSVLTTASTTTSETEINVNVSWCQQCGDMESQTPCTEDEFQQNQASPCGDDLPYCMTDVYKESAASTVKYYKRCVNEVTCLKEYYLQYQQSHFCLHLEPDMPDILVCHLCCHGDNCNNGTVPAADTLYTP